MIGALIADFQDTRPARASRYRDVPPAATVTVTESAGCQYAILFRHDESLFTTPVTKMVIIESTVTA